MARFCPCWPADLAAELANEHYPYDAAWTCITLTAVAAVSETPAKGLAAGSGAAASDTPAKGLLLSAAGVVEG